VNVVHFLLCGCGIRNNKNKLVKNKKIKEQTNNIRRQEETTSAYKWDQGTLYKINSR
jgi:hypothetical protein